VTVEGDRTLQIIGERRGEEDRYMAPCRALPREILAPFPLASQRQCRISERQSREWCAHSDSPQDSATRARGTSGEHRLRPLKLGFRASASFGCCHIRVFL
jgi:hypothetical protein